MDTTDLERIGRYETAREQLRRFLDLSHPANATRPGMDLDGFLLLVEALPLVALAGHRVAAIVTTLPKPAQDVPAGAAEAAEAAGAVEPPAPEPEPSAEAPAAGRGKAAPAGRGGKR